PPCGYRSMGFLDSPHAPGAFVQSLAVKIRFAVKPIAVAVAAGFAFNAHANPTGPSVAAGSAAFQQAGKLLQINNSPGTIINWQSFSIGAGEITKFIQQSSSSAVLNRVTTQNP